jgi:hypothetical protein
MEGAQTLEVPKTTLSALLADMDMAGPINLLKIDVSFGEWLAWAPPCFLLLLLNRQLMYCNLNQHTGAAGLRCLVC